MSLPDKPIPASYWVVPGSFLAGEHPSVRDEDLTRQRLSAFVAAGLDTYIDLSNDGERPDYLPLLQAAVGERRERVEYRHFPFPNYYVPPAATMIAVLDAIDAALAQGRRVYLHCVGGIGRTGTVVGCWLARHGRSGRGALAELAGLYQSSAQSSFAPHSPENSRQIAFVEEWSE